MPMALSAYKYGMVAGAVAAVSGTATATAIAVRVSVYLSSYRIYVIVYVIFLSRCDAREAKININFMVCTTLIC